MAKQRLRIKKMARKKTDPEKYLVSVHPPTRLKNLKEKLWQWDDIKLAVNNNDEASDEQLSSYFSQSAEMLNEVHVVEQEIQSSQFDWEKKMWDQEQHYRQMLLEQE
jgi:U3 small nucleolar ribonucleoprotein component